MSSGVYQIRNIINNKRYIGSTVDIGKRWKEHKNALDTRCHCNRYLQRAWDKHLEESFVFEILELVLQGVLSKSELRVPLLAREQYYKDLYKSYDRARGYDICKVAGSTLGIKLSEEVKKKMSISLLGHKLTNETKSKISKTRIEKGLSAGANNFNYGKKEKSSFYGKHHSDETKRKMRQKALGRKHSKDAKLKMSIHAKERFKNKENHPMYGYGKSRKGMNKND